MFSMSLQSQRTLKGHAEYIFLPGGPRRYVEPSNYLSGAPDNKWASTDILCGPPYKYVGAPI